MQHAALLTGLLTQAMHRDGSLVVVEPALRDRTRHLHAVRDALLAGRSATVFAPCLHQDPCPMGPRPQDWCHEDLAVDLPPWLVPVARGAGLRHEGLTFSYLVLRQKGPALRELVAPATVSPMRLVSQKRRSKGKWEAFVCGELPGDARLVRIMRLDREARGTAGDEERMARGDVLAIEPPLSPGGGRVAPETIFTGLTVAGRPASQNVDHLASPPIGDVLP